MVASHVNVETSSVKDVKNYSKEKMIYRFTYKTCMKIDGPDHSPPWSLLRERRKAPQFQEFLYDSLHNYSLGTKGRGS